MNDFSDSTDRKPVEFVLFALAFVGFILGAAGMVLTSLPVALIGTVILLLAVSCFRSPPES